MENVDQQSPDTDELTGILVREWKRKTTKNIPHRTSRDTLGHATIESREPLPRPRCDPLPALPVLLHSARRRLKQVSQGDLATGLGGVGAKVKLENGYESR